MPGPSNENRPDPPLVSSLRGDPAMQDLIESFVAALPARLDAMREALHSQRLDELQRLAHQFKGACGGYGFAEISDVAARLESALRAAGRENALAAVLAAENSIEELAAVCHRAVA